MGLHNVSIVLPQSSVSKQFMGLVAGASVAGIKFSVTGDATLAPQVIPGPAPYTANFTGVEEGNYTATFQAVDSEGNALGGAVTQNFTVPPSGVAVDIPVGPATITVA